MIVSNAPILSLLLAVPVVGALLLALLNANRPGLLKGIALGCAAIEFALSLPLFFAYQPQGPAVQFLEEHVWIAALGAGYRIGVDGLNLLLILLTTFLTLLAVLSSWTAVSKNLKGYLIAMLLLETGMIGVFASLDLLLFYVFWEATLIPMYLLIGVWGGERRIYAAVKFFLYTMAGSVLMLVAILVLYVLNGQATGSSTFSLPELIAFSQRLPRGTQMWLFLAFFIAFAIKVPLFPFHTWLPDAHTEAPTAGSVILAGVLLKMGVYGLLRFGFPLFPEAVRWLAPYISILALIGIIYGALVALGAFALTTQGLSGGILQMINHGLSTGALFLLVGMIYERRHTRQIADFGGLWKAVPVFSVLFLIVTFSSIGLPGTNGFVGEFLILLGAFRSWMVYGIIGTAGIILAAVYMLWMYQRVFFGANDKAANQKLVDLNAREIFTLAPLVLLILVIGWYPAPFLSRIQPAVESLLRLFN